MQFERLFGSRQLGTVSAGIIPYDRNFRHLVLDIGWFGLGFVAINRYLAVYALHLGADTSTLGVILALPSLLMLVSSMLAARWIAHFGNAVRAHLIPGILYRLMFLLPFFAPFFPREVQPVWLMISVAVPALAQGIAGVIFQDLINQAIPGGRLTSLLSMRSLLFNMTLAASALAFGLWLEAVPFPVNYQAMFLLAFVFTMFSFVHVSLLRVPDKPKVVQPARTVEHNRPPQPHPFRQPQFRRVALVIMLVYVGFLALQAITPAHLVNNLGASEGFLALFGLVELMAGAFASAVTGRVLARFGLRTLLVGSMVLLAAAAVLFALAPVPGVALLGAALSGAAWTATSMVALYAYFASHTPKDEMPRYGAAYHQVVAVAGFIGPLFGSALVNLGLPMVAVLLVGAALRLLIGGLVMGANVRIAQNETPPIAFNEAASGVDAEPETAPSWSAA
jgi:MFS family permease